ncbi:hypothetical protein [Cellulosimicrobium composti]|uniref:hypothetical protein n=1 Tax=Cellulosimicrobium composti TaxID=2672572 RepID=UPI001CEDBA5F|nr:hypothetical protein [Cellulosimicrobium composti]
MARIDDLLVNAVKSAGPKPDDDAPQGQKNPWVGRLSNALAVAIAEELRARGMAEARPGAPGELGLSGAERRLAGGTGAKKVDVTWATEESGLILACSVKTIMFRDKGSGAFQKNLTNRRGDLLMEAVTLHRRFPYAVLAGFLFLDHRAADDHTPRRRSTFENAFPRLRLFTRRPDPTGREEQFERLYLLLVDSNAFQPTVTCYEVNDPTTPVDLEAAFDDVVALTAERNFDLYEPAENGSIRKAR